MYAFVRVWLLYTSVLCAGCTLLYALVRVRVPIVEAVRCCKLLCGCRFCVIAVLDGYGFLLYIVELYGLEWGLAARLHFVFA